MASDNSIYFKDSSDVVWLDSADVVWISAAADVTIEISNASITVTGYVPAIDLTNNITIEPAVSGIVLTGYSPVIAVSNHVTIEPSNSSIIVTGYALTAVQNTPIVISNSNVTVVGHELTIAVSNDVIVDINNAAVTVTGHAPVTVTNITFVDSSTATVVTNNYYELTLPTTQEGDIVIVVSGSSGVFDYVGGVLEFGWSKVADLWSNDSRDMNLAVCWKRMGSTPDTAVTILPPGAGNQGEAIAYVLRGCDEHTVIDVVPTTDTGIDSAVPDAPSITPITAGTIILAIGGGSSYDTSVTAPSGYTNHVQAQSTNGYYSTVAIASKLWSGSGAEDPGAWTDWTTLTSNAWCACTLAIRPSGVVDEPTITRVGDVGNSEETATSVEVTLPTSLENDIVIVTVSNTGVVTSDRDIGISTSGYTEISELWGDDTYEANVGVFWKRMGGTPDTTVTGTTNANSGNGLVILASVFRGVDTTTALDVTSTTATGINSSTPNAPSITPVTDGSLVVLCAGCVDGLPTVIAPIGFESHNVVDKYEFALQHTSAMHASMYWDSGVVDPAEWEGIPTSTSAAWCATSLVLRPAAASDDIDIVPAVGEITFAGYAPVIDNPIIVEPAIGEITFTGYTSVTNIDANVTIQPTNGAITFTGQSITLVGTIPINNGVITLTGYLPEITVAGVVELGVGEITFTGLTVSVKFEPVISVANTYIIVNGYAPKLFVWGAIPEFGVAELTPAPTKTVDHDPCGHWHQDLDADEFDPEWDFIEQGTLPFTYHKDPIHAKTCGHWHKWPVLIEEGEEELLIPILRAFDVIGDEFIGWLVWYTGSIYDTPLFVAKDPTDIRGWEINEQDIADAIHLKLHGSTGSATITLLEKRQLSALGDLEYAPFDPPEYCCGDNALYFDYSESMNIDQWNNSQYGTDPSPYEHRFLGAGTEVLYPNYPRFHTGSFYRRYDNPKVDSIWEDVYVSAGADAGDIFYTTTKGEDNFYTEVYSNKIHQIWLWGNLIIGDDVHPAPYCGGGWDDELEFGVAYQLGLSGVLTGCKFGEYIIPETGFPEAKNGVLVGADGEIDYTYGLISMWPHPFAPIFIVWQGSGVYYDWVAGRQFDLSQYQWCVGESYQIASEYMLGQNVYDYEMQISGAAPQVVRKSHVESNYKVGAFEVGIKYVFSHKGNTTREFIPQHGQGSHLKERTYLNNFGGSIGESVPPPYTADDGLLVDSSSSISSNGKFGEIQAELVTRDGAKPEYLYFGSPLSWTHNRNNNEYEEWAWLVYYNSITKVFESLGFNIPFENINYDVHPRAVGYGYYQAFIADDTNSYYINLYEWEVLGSSIEQYAKAKRFVALYSDETYIDHYGTTMPHSPVWEFEKQGDV